MRKPRSRCLPPASITFLFLLTALAVCGPGKAADRYAFNGGRAFEDLRRLVAFGPRPAGSKALDQSRQWIIEQLHRAGCTVREDSFTVSTAAGNLPMTNLLVELPGQERDKIVILAGHYDTKLEPNFRFVGANDGGSSATFLLEMARELKPTQHKLTYWLVFFDGEEDLKQQWSENDNTFGSRHLVQKLTADGTLSRIRAMILVDMIADARLDIRRDQDSTPWLTDLIFHAAEKLGYGRYFLHESTAIEDDHTPFVNAGVSAVDVIDFNYGPDNSYWHSANDVVEHCSPSSLTIVGRVVKAALETLDNSPRIP